MAAIVAITLIIVGLALLAQGAKKSRRAEISLLVILLLLSGLILLVSVMLTLTFVRALSAGAGAEPMRFGIAALTLFISGASGLALCIPPLMRITGRLGPAGSDMRMRRSLYRWSEPTMFLAAWLFVQVLANNVISLVAFEQIATVLTAPGSGRVSPGEVILSQLPFFLAALAGVGLWLRRDLRETISRLGYHKMTLPQLGAASGFVVAALGLSYTADYLFKVLQPDLYERVGEVSGSLFNTEGLTPLYAVLFGLLIGIGAALGEETLFRGAVQPALGIMATSVLFASMHYQYGPSFLLIYILLLSVGLGLLRKRFNTTVSFTAHAGYNFAGVMLQYLFGF